MHSDIISQSGVVEMAEVARILSDPTRLRILKALFQNREGICVYEIAKEVGSSPSATSHQLAKLESYEIVLCYREGQKMCYELTDGRLVSHIGKILRLFSVV